MAQFLEFKPNDAQSEVREVINNNFKNATLKPSENSGEKLFSIVGVQEANSQQLNYAKDGLDYLSPETGVMKDSGDQIINGKVTAEGLVISDKGAVIAKHLYVYDTNEEGSPSFVVNEDKSSIAYGTLEVQKDTTLKQKLTVENGIESVNTKNNLGESDFTNIKVSNTGTFTTLSATNSTLGTLQVTGNASVNGTTTLKNSLTISGRVTMNERVLIPAPGEISINYVRTLKAVNRAPKNGEVAHGTLWGQY